MKINFCGINQAHTKSFIINRPSGSGDNLFIYTRTPIIVVSKDKVDRYPADTVIFYRKGSPQHFMAAGQFYANDYIHFDASPEEMDFIDSLSIPSGVPFTGLDPTAFINIHRYICVEYQTESEHKGESIDLLLRYFLIKLSDAIKESSLLSVSGSTKSAMRELRVYLYSNSEKQHRIDELAARVGLSTSYFQMIYKNLFGRSCIDDIIIARINKAKALLGSTDMSISAVASSCGYESDAHFSRQFKKTVGVTPSEYRKSNSKDEIL